MAEKVTLDDFHLRQKRERKDLLAKTQKMKHAIPKGDKKKKKEVTEEIARMLAEQDLKHEEERRAFDARFGGGDAVKLDNACEKPSQAIVKSEENAEDLESSESTKNQASEKLSKAQKRRNKKILVQKERERAIAKQELQNLSGNRYKESEEIIKKLSQRQLTIQEIPPDGNCLYTAIEHQLSTLDLEPMTVKSLREKTSKYLLSHKDDYLPFLTDLYTGEILSDEQFVQYCEDIEKTTAWGGQVEIQILSKICERPIEVIQAEGPSIIAGEEFGNPKLLISYHRHVFGLGEHYNSVIPCNNMME